MAVLQSSDKDRSTQNINGVEGVGIAKLQKEAPVPTEAQTSTSNAQGIQLVPPQPPAIQMMSDEEERLQLKCEDCEKERVQPQLIQPSATDATQPIASNFASQLNHGGGQALPKATSQEMGQKIGADFEGVKVHTGPHAIQLSRAINAKAFTYGNDVYFNEGQYNPNSSQGKHLLAHELTHTVQQGASPQVQTKEAGGIHHSVVQRTPMAKKMIQKTDGETANTAYGHFEAVSYHPVTSIATGQKVGTEMYLKFHPGANVDAESIGLVQTATVISKGSEYATRTGGQYAKRSATEGPGTNTFIDRLEGNPNPVYGTGDTPDADKPADDLDSYPDAPPEKVESWQIPSLESWSKVRGVKYNPDKPTKKGYFYEKEGVEQGPETAELYDVPLDLKITNNSERIFETAAIALKGSQKGTYYGSVRWGWKKDNAGAFSVEPLTTVSEAVPTDDFLTAAKIWNSAAEDVEMETNKEDVSIKTAANSLIELAVVPDAGTKMTMKGYGTSEGKKYYAVTIPEILGTAVGLINIDDVNWVNKGRDTVDLPVTEVYTVNEATTLDSGIPEEQGNGTALPAGTRVTMVDEAPPDHLEGYVKVKVGQGDLTLKSGWVDAALLTREELGSNPWEGL